jgi:hypothetical protein
MAFCTSNEVKQHLFNDTSGATYDALITQTIAFVDDYITQRLGIPTGALGANLAVVDEILDSKGRTEIKVKSHPINSLTTIERRDSNWDWETYTAEAIGDIEFEKDTIYSKYIIAGEAERALRITYNAGYATADVPADLKQAAIILVGVMFNLRQNHGQKAISMLGFNQNVSSLADGQSSDTAVDLQMVEGIFNRYAKVVVL